MREFETGATRDDDDGKLEHWGFSSAVVEKRYSEYMHSHRTQANGKLRDSNNWCKGIPAKVYKHSLSRHINDLRLVLEGFPELAEETDLEIILCAVKFNVDGLLFETVKERITEPRPKPAGETQCTYRAGVLYPEDEDEGRVY